MTGDQLLAVETAVEAAVRERNLTLFRADDLSWLWTYDESGSRDTTSDVVSWREGDGWEEFIRTATAIGVRVLYIDSRRFSANDLVGRIDGMSRLEPDEAARRRKRAEEFREYDGYVEQLVLGFRADGIWHVYQDVTDWSLECAELEAEGDPVEEGEEERLSEERLEGLAGDLARSPSFARVRSKGDQMALARKMFAKEGEMVLDSLGEIVARARLVFQTEVASAREHKQPR